MEDYIYLDWMYRCPQSGHVIFWERSQTVVYFEEKTDIKAVATKNKSKGALGSFKNGGLF
ncbi:hypothetical protein IX51_05665 [uncultured archaeon]|nr:hypothetical protein IX51_05665 [uncultured archaeon]